MEDLRRAEATLTIEGEDGFELRYSSRLVLISRDPEALVAHAMGNHHYPDGMMLFLGTPFAPIEDRDAAGRGFTHKVGDRVTIANESLGALVNLMRLAPDCPP